MNKVIFIAVFMMLAVMARAGGGPQNVLVVVNQNSSNSVAVGKHYLQQRGISERNLLRIATTNERNISASAFSNEIRGPIFSYLEESGLDDQIDYVVFSMDIPYRVFVGDFADGRHAGLTAAMYYDVFTSPNAFISGCDLAAGSSNQYFGRETAFRRPEPPVNARYRISAMLTASNRTQALELVTRASAADFTNPDATVFFEHGEDFRRNGRWTQYEETAFSLRFIAGGPSALFVDGFDDSTPRTNAIGLMTGLQTYPRFASTEFVPGAFAEQLTSFGGFLFNSNEGEGWREPWQTKALSWTIHGAVGSQGTVVEPCAYPQKFPDAKLHLWYGRGFSLGEAYYLAMENPYQGIFVGDPLTQPYAAPPDVTVSGLASNQTVSGDVALTITSRVGVVTGGVDRLDVYVNDLFVATAHRRPLAASNIVTAVIGGHSSSYTVKTNDTLADVAAGLAAAINTNPAHVPTRAFAAGDRILLRQRTLNGTGTGITYSVSVAQGAATNVGLLAWTAGSNLVVSTIGAYREIVLTGNVSTVDTFSTAITRLDGVVITNTVTAASGWNTRTVMQQLRAAINADTNLHGNAGVLANRYSEDPYVLTEARLVLTARTTGPTGMSAMVSFSGSNGSLGYSGSGAFTSNTNVLGARGMIFLSAGAPEVVATYTLPTTNFPDGPHTLRVVAHRGDGPGVQGHARIPFRIQNHTLVCAITNLTTNVVSYYEPVMLHAGYTAMSGTVTSVVFWVEGKMAASVTNEPFTASFDPAYYDVGNITVQVQAFNDLGQSALSDPVALFISKEVTTSSGVPHAWLVQFGITNNLEAATLDDPDGDGAMTWQEYFMNTDPLNGESVLRVAAFAETDDQHVLQWPGVTGRVYELLYSTILSGSWHYVSGATNLPGLNNPIMITNSAPPSSVYYRVHVDWPDN